MSAPSPDQTDFLIRPLQYRDLEILEEFAEHQKVDVSLPWLSRWYWPFKVLSLFANPLRQLACVFTAEASQQVVGFIHAAPFNRSRSNWGVQQVLSNPAAAAAAQLDLSVDVESRLLRHCLETIWEARTWLTEVDVSDKPALALYRKNGFQPLAQQTQWLVSPESLKSLAAEDQTLPTLMPVSNAEASLLYQLDTVSMPPLLRQVFDRHVPDFQSGVVDSLSQQMRQWTSTDQTITRYVFEPQRKAAIGYFRLVLSKENYTPHRAELTVHPAYTWLYPKLLICMARLAQTSPSHSLLLMSADYQPEREAYLESIEAEQVQHTLLMSRSVWHKLKEQRTAPLEGLQLADVLQGLQPRNKPVPGRINWSFTAEQPQTEKPSRPTPSNSTPLDSH
ncbi:MAG: GNAT family N-acetyltransferase [Cyanobacteria bacterium P01_H01_bin.121]